jgi:hypothetical protein
MRRLVALSALAAAIIATGALPALAQQQRVDFFDTIDEEILWLEGEIVRVDVDNGILYLQDVRIDPTWNRASMVDVELPEKLLVRIGEDTRITDRGKKTVLAQLATEGRAHVKMRKQDLFMATDVQTEGMEN